MKSSIFDYLLSGTVIVTLLLLAGFSTAYLITPYTTSIFKDFHVLTDGATFILLYGLFSAVVVKTCLKVHPILHGTFSMDTSVFFYWKFITVIYEFGKYSLQPFTTFITKPMIESLFGAKTGSNVVSAGYLVDPWSITVSDNAILGLNSALVSHAITNNRIILKPVVVHKGATIGVNCVIMPGSIIGENSIVLANAVVKMDSFIPANEIWGGNPAQLIKKTESTEHTKMVGVISQTNEIIFASTAIPQTIEFKMNKTH
jgi:hypothetical protein